MGSEIHVIRMADWQPRQFTRGMWELCVEHQEIVENLISDMNPRNAL